MNPSLISSGLPARTQIGTVGRSATAGIATAALLAALAPHSLAPRLPPPPPPKAFDYDRFFKAQEKKRRKLERLTNTPQARARRAEIESDPRFVPYPAPINPITDDL